MSKSTGLVIVGLSANNRLFWPLAAFPSLAQRLVDANGNPTICLTMGQKPEQWVGVWQSHWLNGVYAGAMTIPNCCFANSVPYRACLHIPTTGHNYTLVAGAPTTTMVGIQFVEPPNCQPWEVCIQFNPACVANTLWRWVTLCDVNLWEHEMLFSIQNETCQPCCPGPGIIPAEDFTGFWTHEGGFIPYFP